MIIAIAANSKDPKSIVGSRFCTAKYFHLIDSTTRQTRVIENPQSNTTLDEIEAKAANLIISNHVEMVLTGLCGPQAFKSLSSAGIQVVTAVQEGIQEAVKNYCFWDDDNEYSLDAEPWWNWR